MAPNFKWPIRNSSALRFDLLIFILYSPYKPVLSHHNPFQIIVYPRSPSLVSVFQTCKSSCGLSHLSVAVIWGTLKFVYSFADLTLLLMAVIGSQQISRSRSWAYPYCPTTLLSCSCQVIGRRQLHSLFWTILSDSFVCQSIGLAVRHQHP